MAKRKYDPNQWKGFYGGSKSIKRDNRMKKERRATYAVSYRCDCCEFFDDDLGCVSSEPCRNRNGKIYYKGGYG